MKQNLGPGAIAAVIVIVVIVIAVMGYKYLAGPPKGTVQEYMENMKKSGMATQHGQH